MRPKLEIEGNFVRRLRLSAREIIVALALTGATIVCVVAPWLGAPPAPWAKLDRAPAASGAPLDTPSR